MNQFIDRWKTHRGFHVWVTVIEYVIVTLIPVIAFYLMETYEHNPFSEVRPMAQWLNILLFELLGWVLFFGIGKARTAMRVELVFAMVFGLTNHYVMAFRSTPLVPWDLLSIRTAASVASEYSFAPNRRTVLVTLGFLCLIALLQLLKLKAPGKWYCRVGACVFVCLLVVGYTKKLQNEQFQNEHNLYPFLFTPGYMTKVNGMTVTFTMNLKYLAVEKPDGYSAARAEEILAKYETGTTSENELPNIIVIMDEAFSDLSVLGELDANQDYMPYIRNLMAEGENVVSGYADVSVCGGNTANSEFEFLTGNTMAFLPNGSIPYQQYIKKNTFSLAAYLKNLGYDTYGQHPYNASGWSRDKVYPLLGFDDTRFLKDYDYRKYVRKYESDMADVRQIISTYEKRNRNVPMFLFNVTMQNHGSYTENYDNFTPDVEALGQKSSVVNKYLSLLKLTDESIEYLISYFENQSDKTVIVFFGDHQPNGAVANPVFLYQGLNPEQLTEEQRLNRYKVPFFIWANYDIEEKRNQNLSLNYLGGEVLEAAGVSKPAYMNLLEEVQKQYTSISAVSRKESSDYDSKIAKELLEKYQIVQYYYLFDRKQVE